MCILYGVWEHMNVYSGTSITALQIKDTSVIQTTTNSPKQSAIKKCTYLTSKLRTPLYSVLRTLDLVPNGHIAWLANSIIRSRPRPQASSLAVVLQFYTNHREDSLWDQNTRYRDITPCQTSFGPLLLVWVVSVTQVSLVNWWVWLVKLWPTSEQRTPL